MDEIDQFILTNFSKLDKKIKQKEKKEKPAVKSKEESSLILSNIIDEGIYSSISSDKKNLDLRKEIISYFPNEKLYETEFTEKVFLLDKFFKNKKKKSKECNKASRLIKKLNFDGFKYNDFLIANELWKKYILQLIEPKSVNLSGVNMDGVYEKFLKADLHGCKLKVFKSNVENLIGREGIVVLETQRTFVIITRENKINKILKSANEFLIQINDNFHIKLIGDNFNFRPIDRTKKGKFKEKYIIKN